MTLWYCITYAYGARSYQVAGPDWLKEVRYDIVAKGVEGTRHEQLPQMLQSLLAERLKLQIHHETQEIAGLALVLDKDGPRLKPSPPESGDGQGGAKIGMSATAEGVEKMDVKGAPMTTLANTLTSLLGRPVVDKTGLAGLFDFVLEFSRADGGGRRTGGGYNEPPPLPPPVPGGEPGLSIYSSIRQLGLKLEARKMSIDMVIVDSAQRTPDRN